MDAGDDDCDTDCVALQLVDPEADALLEPLVDSEGLAEIVREPDCVGDTVALQLHDVDSVCDTDAAGVAVLEVLIVVVRLVVTDRDPELDNDNDAVRVELVDVDGVDDIDCENVVDGDMDPETVREADVVTVTLALSDGGTPKHASGGNDDSKL